MEDKMTKTYKKYSEAIKKQVVAEYEQGSSISELNRKYGITGGMTVKNWIKKYAKEGFRHNYIRVQTIEEINQVKTLENRVKELELALGKTTLEKLKLESIIEELEETYGLDELKKNGVPSSTDSSTKSQHTQSSQ
jgi:transposase-like protein